MINAQSQAVGAQAQASSRERSSNAPSGTSSRSGPKQMHVRTGSGKVSSLNKKQQPPTLPTEHQHSS